MYFVWSSSDRIMSCMFGMNIGAFTLVLKFAKLRQLPMEQ